MTTKRFLFSSSIVALCAAWTAVADHDTVKSPNPQVNPHVAPGLEQLGKAQKAHEVIGMTVKNDQNEKLGKVADLAVDLHEGRIVELIVSTGGILGAGSKHIAVPPHAFTFDPDNSTLRLTADKEKLRRSPEFDLNKWEVSTQPGTVSEVYRVYGEAPNYRRSAETRQLDRGSKIIGMTVKNLKNHTVGEVEDMVINLPASRIVQVVVSSGGFLGLGEELSSVPPAAFRFNDKRNTLQLDVTKETLANAPHFKANQWPNVEDPAYVSGVYRAYHIEPYFRTDIDRNSTVKTDSVTDADNTARNERDRKSQTLTPIDQGNSSADIKLTQQIRKEIVATKDLSVNARNVKIITVDGKVTLRGPVRTEDEKRVIGEIAERLAPGNVDNQLDVGLTAKTN